MEAIHKENYLKPIVPRVEDLGIMLYGVQNIDAKY